jgi:hypothetical protein
MRIGEIVREGEREVPGWEPQREPQQRESVPERRTSEPQRAPEKVPDDGHRLADHAQHRTHPRSIGGFPGGGHSFSRLALGQPFQGHAILRGRGGE